MSLSLNVISREECEQRASVALGGTPTSEAKVAELLRRETRAWGSRAKHLLLASVKSLRNEEETASAGEILERLLGLGDLLEGPGAVVSPGPLRLVDLPAGGWVLLGAVGNREAESLLGEGTVQQGIPRRVHRATPETKVQGLCEQFRGVRLSLLEASGLAEAPDAAAHLGMLDRRREGTRPEEEAEVSSWLDVQGFGPGSGWKAAPTTPLPRLLRGRNNGYTVFGWGASPEGKVMKISTDDARRAVFCLCAEQQTPVQANLQKEGDDQVWIEIPYALPRAEYRAVRMLREGATPDGKKVLMEASSWSWLRQNLSRTLRILEAISP